MTEVIENIRREAEPAEDLIFVVNRKAAIQYVTGCAAVPFGCRPQEMIGKPLTNFLPCPEHLHLEENLQTIFETGKPLSFAGDITLEDRCLCLETKLTPITDKEGEVVSILGISREVDASERSAGSFARTGRKWQLAVDSMKHLMAVIDDRYRIEGINRAMAKKLGLSLKQAMNLPCYERLHSSGEPPRFCPLLPGISNGAEDVVERCDTLFGGQYLFSVSPVKNRQSKVIGCIYVARGKTEAEKKQAEREERRQSMKALMKKAEHLVFIQDVEAKYLFFYGDSGTR